MRNETNNQEIDSREHCFSKVPVPEEILDWLKVNSVLSIVLSDYKKRGSSFEDILQNDARIVSYEKSEIILRKGDYGGSVLIPIEGTVRVNLEQSQEHRFARKSKLEKRSWFSAIGQLFKKKKTQETFSRVVSQEEISGSAGRKPRLNTDIDKFVSQNLTRRIGIGEIFGEIAALRRCPRTASVFAGTDCKLIEIRWQGVRDLLARSNEFERFLEDIIGDRRHQIFSFVNMIQNLSEDVQRTISSKAVFERHGSDDWNRNFRKVINSDKSLLDQEAVVLNQGHHMDGLYVVLNGFARVTRKDGGQESTTGYLRPGDVYGLKELTRMDERGEDEVAFHTIRAVGALDLVIIPKSDFNEHVLPEIQKGIETGRSNEEGYISRELLDFFVDRRIVNGNQTMIIDLNRCTDCDDCVKACAVTHGGDPRFIREGHRHAELMVATACMHCADPVCLVGCPTGAIHREANTGNVIITTNECIGCGTCVESCPYNNIRSVEIHDAAGNPIINLETGKPALKATKCDLCIDQPSGPACANACPHDALHRVDFSDISKVTRVIEKITG